MLVDGVDASASQVGQAGEEELDEGPSPIAPEAKELLWGGGAFLVFLVLMRLCLVPKVKQGMDARYGKIRGDSRSADDIRAAGAARGRRVREPSSPTVRAEATARIDAARRQLEAERAERLAEVNAAHRRRGAPRPRPRPRPPRTAARADDRRRRGDVASRAVELTIGKRPDPDVVRRAVADVTSVGAER